MPALESLKKGIERVTGLWRPTHAQLRNIRRRVPPKLLKFASDGKTPNNPALPVIVYPRAVLFDAFDPAAVFEVLFASNGWTDSWRDGMYPYAQRCPDDSPMVASAGRDGDNDAVSQRQARDLIGNDQVAVDAADD